MNIHSVDNQNFTSQRERGIIRYNPPRNLRQNIDTVINLDDNSVKKLAYINTVNKVEDDKHKKITKLLLASVPFVAGVSEALIAPAKSKVLTKDITGTAARLLNGAKATAGWAALFGAGSALWNASNYLEKKSPNFEKFNNQYPFLAFAGQVAAFTGAIILGMKAAPKIIEQAGKYIDKSAIADLEFKFAKQANSFNKNTIVSAVTKKAHDLKTSKYLAPLGGVTELVTSWAPYLVGAGGVLHAMHHSNVKRDEMTKNYTAIKDYQLKLAKARINELSLQNDFLLQDANNREAVRLVKQPLSDLPQEVTDKIVEIREARTEA